MLYFLEIHGHVFFNLYNPAYQGQKVRKAHFGFAMIKYPANRVNE